MPTENKTEINVTLNGEAKRLPGSECTGMALNEAIILWGYEDKKIVVAINECFVLKEDYQTTFLTGEERIDIVRPIQGG